MGPRPANDLYGVRDARTVGRSAYPVVLAVLAHDILRDCDGADLPGVPSSPTPAANDAAYRLRLVPLGDPIRRSNTKPLARRRDHVLEEALTLYEEFHPCG